MINPYAMTSWARKWHHTFEMAHPPSHFSDGRMNGVVVDWLSNNIGQCHQKWRTRHPRKLILEYQMVVYNFNATVAVTEQTLVIDYQFCDAPTALLFRLKWSDFSTDNWVTSVKIKEPTNHQGWWVQRYTNA
jgi:hypothetical protein